MALGDKRPAPKAHVAQTCANTDVMPTPANIELVRAAILCLHNQIRAQNNLPLLKDNLKLRKAATGHSSDMVDEGYFDHTSPAGETFVDRILGSGYAKNTDGWTLGENLAWGTGDLSTANGVMNAWMNSAGPQGEHPQALLQGDRDRHPPRRPVRRDRRRDVHDGVRREVLAAFSSR